VGDPIPAGIASVTWSCAGSGGAGCPNVSGTASANPAGGMCMPGNMAPPCVATSIVSSPASAPKLSISKTANQSELETGGTVIYTIAVDNVGTVPALGTEVDDPIPAGLSDFAWTCTASGGAVCPSASGSGAISDAIAAFPAGGSLLYTVTAIVSAEPPAMISNTASVSSTGLVTCAPSGSPAACSASAAGSVQPRQPANTTPTPTLNVWMLTLLGAMLAAIGWRARRHSL
jgi:uncharacterized repeat protein (TIGR01451 family)